MTIKKRLSLALVAILVLSAIVMFRVSPVFAQEPYVGVDPPRTISSEGETFAIEINVSSTVPFVAYQFYLYWNRTLINATGIIETPPPSFTFQVGAGLQWDYNATYGRVKTGWVDPNLVSITGTFTVATITFEVIESPPTQTIVSLDLDYENSGVWDQMGIQITPYYVYDGDVTVAAGPIPYVAVSPTHTIAPPNTFTIEINISSSVPFVGYQFYLYWNRTYINATGMTETPPSTWNPFYAGWPSLQWNYNATHGRIERGVVDMQLVPVTGAFTVATITFEVIESPPTPTVVSLDLGYEDTGVWDQMGNQIMPYRVYDGDVTVTGGPETTIAVYPSELRRYQGLPFAINITISAVQDLYGFDTYLCYDSTLLNAISITEGPFLESAGTTIEVLNEINNAEGYVRYALALMGAPAGADGSGTLFTVTFEASHSTTGTTDLNLEDVKLSDSEAEPIPRTVLNGSVTVVEFERIDHLVIVNGIEYYITTISTSEVTNFEYDHPQRTISFDIEGAPDVPGILNITIPKALITLPQGDTFIVLFDNAAILSTRTENATHYLLSFTYSHSSHTIQIKQTLIGDLSGDQTVSMVDIVIVNLAYDATPTDPNWNPLADLASPWGKIDIFDFVKVSSKYDLPWTPR